MTETDHRSGAWRWGRWVVAALVVATLLTAGSIALGSNNGDGATVTLTRGDLAISAEVEGVVEAVDPATLGPPAVPGIWNYRISFLAPEGAEVREGEPVLAFDAEELQGRLRERVADRDSAAKEIEKRQFDLAKQREQVELQLAEARAKLRRAELQLETPENLVAANELASQRIDRDLAKEELAYLEERLALLARRTEVEIGILEETRTVAAARVSQIEGYLDRMQVAAPRDGIVIYEADWQGEKKKVGDQAWPGRSILQIPNLDSLRGSATVAEADLSRIAAGQAVTFRLDAHPDRTYTGRLTKIGRTVQRRSAQDPRRVVRVEIAFEENDPERLRPGLRFRGEVETDRLEGVLLMPVSSVVATADGPVVYRKTWHGVEPVHPELGRVSGERVEVLSGLTEGDRVLLDPTSGDGADPGGEA